MESVLLSMAVLACPLGMGLMMWFMMRGGRGERHHGERPPSIAGLRAEQQRLGAEIEQLERSRSATRV